MPVFPVIPYGVTPQFRSYPGTVSLRVETFLALVTGVLDALREQGFRRIAIVNGHGGNVPVEAKVREWAGDHPETKVRFHNWWSAPLVWKKVQEIDPAASHASWMENMPWTRLAGVAMPDAQKPMVDFERFATPAEVRRQLGDGNFGGRYFRSDEEVLALWKVAVEETRAILGGGW